MRKAEQPLPPLGFLVAHHLEAQQAEAAGDFDRPIGEGPIEVRGELLVLRHLAVLVKFEPGRDGPEGGVQHARAGGRVGAEGDA